MDIPAKSPVGVVVSVPDDRALADARSVERLLCDLANVGKAEFGIGLAKPKASATELVEKVQLFVPLHGLIDFDEERRRLRKRIENVQGQLQASERKLADPNFRERAPGEIVTREQERLQHLSEQVDKLCSYLGDLD
jgi:valyl-tRNA synthetase